MPLDVPYKAGNGIAPVPDDGSEHPIPKLTRCKGCGRSMYWLLATGPPRCDACRDGAEPRPA